MNILGSELTGYTLGSFFRGFEVSCSDLLKLISRHVKHLGPQYGRYISHTGLGLVVVSDIVPLKVALKHHKSHLVEGHRRGVL